MLEGYSQCCVTFVRIGPSIILAILTCTYHHWSGSTRFRIISSGKFTVHGKERVTQLSLISGHANQVFHADFCPRLVKYDVTLPPVIA